AVSYLRPWSFYLRFDSDFRFRAVAWLADPVPSFFPHSNREGFGGVRDGESPNLIFIESGFAESGSSCVKMALTFSAPRKSTTACSCCNVTSNCSGAIGPSTVMIFPSSLSALKARFTCAKATALANAPVARRNVLRETAYGFEADL